MQRRAFMKGILGSSMAGLLPVAGCLKSGEHGQAADGGHASKRPNIIFLLTDDQRWDSLGCVNPILRTPNIDAMAGDGVMFTNAYVTTAICCTSRASFLVGQYARRHGIIDFARQFTDEQLAGTYPMLMKQSGYRVGFVGKYGVGARDLPAASYDFWQGWAGQGNYEGHTDPNGQPIHLTRLMGNQSLEFLETCTTRQPFCLSVSFKAPHCQDGDTRQFIYDPQHEAVYKDVTFPPPKTATEADWQRLPEFLKTHNEARARWEIRFSTPEKYQEMVRNYHRLIYGVDAEVGRIRRKLQEKGLADNTIIIFAGDNGFYLGEHGLAGKWYPHEESIRVPLIIYDPRLPQSRRGKRPKAIALNIDLAPTMLHYAGIQVPAAMQGRDLSCLMEGRSVRWREDFFYEHLFEHKKIPKSEGVVGRRYKYVRWIDQKPVYEELYDLESNPEETINFVNDPGYREVLAAMRRRYEQLLAEAK